MYDTYWIKYKEHSTADSFSYILRVNLLGSIQANAFKHRHLLKRQKGNRGTNRALICSWSHVAKQQFSQKIYLFVNRKPHKTKGSSLASRDFFQDRKGRLRGEIILAEKVRKGRFCAYLHDCDGCHGCGSLDTQVEHTHKDNSLPRFPVQLVDARVSSCPSSSV